MKFLTAICLIIIIVIIFCWIASYLYRNKKLPDGFLNDTIENLVNSANYKYDQYFTSPEKLYEKTVGHEFDATAKLALQKAQKAENMYAFHEATNRMSHTKIADATTNSFILANLLNYNAPNADTQAIRDAAQLQANQYYNTTIRRISDNPTPIQNADFILDRTQDFYDDFALQTLEPETVNEIYGRINVARNNVRAARTAPQPGTVKAKSRQDYYKSRAITSDPQNVHDSYVNANMRQIYTNIKEQNLREHNEVPDLKAAIEKHPFERSVDRNHAMKTFTTMMSGNPISSLDSNERDILMGIWNRIHSEENTESRNSLKSSFMNALAEGMEKNSSGEYHQVCINGRCSKMLGSLTLLDANKKISQPMQTKEMLRNEIYDKSYKIIQLRLAQAPKSVADAYRGLQESAELIEFGESLKAEIDKVLREDYGNIVKKEDLDNLIKDAQAGVDI